MSIPAPIGFGYIPQGDELWPPSIALLRGDEEAHLVEHSTQQVWAHEPVPSTTWDAVAAEVADAFNGQLRAARMPQAQWGAGWTEMDLALGQQLLGVWYDLVGAAPDEARSLVAEWAALRPVDRFERVPVDKRSLDRPAWPGGLLSARALERPIEDAGGQLVLALA